MQIGLKDMRDFEGDVEKYIKDQFPVKEGADPKERAAMNAQATTIKALGNSMFQTNAAVGIPLTAGTVMQAMELAKDRSNVQIVQVNGTAHEAVVVNGQHVITSGALQKKAPAAPGTAPATPAAAARQGVSQPGAQAPAAAQSKDQELTAAYNNWQQIKSQNSKGYFSQKTPSDPANMQAEKDAEAVYTQLLAGRYTK